eukprot:3407119-Amphidinium_carterae.2
MITVMIVSWTALLILLFYLGICEPCESAAEIRAGHFRPSDVSLEQVRMLADSSSESSGSRPCDGAAFDVIGSDFDSMLKALP